MNLVVSTSISPGRLRNWTGNGVALLQFVEGKIVYELIFHQCNRFINKFADLQALRPLMICCDTFTVALSNYRGTKIAFY